MSRAIVLSPSKIIILILTCISVGFLLGRLGTIINDDGSKQVVPNVNGIYVLDVGIHGSEKTMDDDDDDDKTEVENEAENANEPNENESEKDSRSRGPYLRTIKLHFKSFAHRNYFLQWIEPVCNDVYVHEGPGIRVDPTFLHAYNDASSHNATDIKRKSIIGPPSLTKDSSATGVIAAPFTTRTTLSYRVSISDKDPLSVLLVERYSDKQTAFERIHKHGNEFVTFRDKIKGMKNRGMVRIKALSYWETELGYV